MCILQENEYGCVWMLIKHMNTLHQIVCKVNPCYNITNIVYHTFLKKFGRNKLIPFTSGQTIKKQMYQPGAIVEFFRDLFLIQSARFMAMLFVIRLLLTFWISVYRDQQERLEAELMIPQHLLGLSAIYYNCLHYPGEMICVITTLLLNTITQT